MTKKLTKVTMTNLAAANRSKPVDSNIWQPIEPLDAMVYPEPIDRLCMPPKLANIVFHIAEATQTPPEMSYGLAIAVIATAIGKKATVQLPTHKEVSPIWTATAMGPGARKSAVFGLLTEYLSIKEKALIDEYKIELRNWSAKKRLADIQIKGLEQQAKKGGDLDT